MYRFLFFILCSMIAQGMGEKENWPWATFISGALFVIALLPVVRLLRDNLPGFD